MATVHHFRNNDVDVVPMTLVTPRLLRPSVAQPVPPGRDGAAVRAIAFAMPVAAMIWAMVLVPILR